MAVKRSSTHAMTKRRDTQEEIAHKKALETEKKCYKYGAIAIAVIIVIVLLNTFDLLPHLNGSMHYYNGSVRGAKDSDVITCTDKDAHRYYKLGSYTVPAGYENDASLSTRDDKNIKDWYLKKDSDENNLKYIYVAGVPKAWDEMYSTVIGYNTQTDTDGNVTAVPTEYSGTTDSGLKYHLMVTPAAEDAYNGDYDKYAACYVEASHNCSVLIMVYLDGATADSFPADEVFINYAKDAMSGLTVK